MTRECPVRICEGGEVRFLSATRLALFNNDPTVLSEWRLRIERYLVGRRLRLHPRKTMILSCSEPAQFLGFELHADGRRRLPEDNVRRFRNRLRGLRDRWQAGTISPNDVDARVGAWIAHAEHADTWRLRHAIFRGRRFDPANAPEAWTAPCRRVVRGGSWNNNPENLRSANRNRNTTDNRNNNLGFRVGRTLAARADAIMVALGALQASRAVHDEHGCGGQQLASARMTTAAPVLGDAWAPTGAAGCSGDFRSWWKRKENALRRLSARGHGLPCRRRVGDGRSALNSRKFDAPRSSLGGAAPTSGPTRAADARE